MVMSAWIRQNQRLAISLAIMVLLSLDLVIETPFGWTVLRKLFVGVKNNAVGVPCGWDYEASWKIGYGFGNSPESMHFNDLRSREPIITCGHVLRPAASFVADPFLFIPNEYGLDEASLHHGKSNSKGNTSLRYLFYELKNLDRIPAIGEIGASVSTDNGINWKYHGVVLSDEVHLSFPNVVFDFQSSKLLMFPETSGANELRIYTTSPEEFPSGWKVLETPLSSPARNGRWVDTTMIWSEVDACWWIWTSENWNLHLFSTPHLVGGTWTEHPQSPIYHNDRRLGRNGGTVFEHNGHIYRFAQDCTLFYGKELVVMQVTQLTATTYVEEEVDQIVHPGSPSAVAKALWHDAYVGANTLWNSERIHHINMHKLHEDGPYTYFAVLDGDDRIDKSFHHYREGWFITGKFVILSIAVIAVLYELLKSVRISRGSKQMNRLFDRSVESQTVSVIVATLIFLLVVLLVICKFFQRCFRPVMYF